MKPLHHYKHALSNFARRTIGPVLALTIAITFLIGNHAYAGKNPAPTPAPAAPAKDQITITPLTSSNGVVPTTPGFAPRNVFYMICVPSGGASSYGDTLHVDLTVTDGNGVAGPDGTVSFSQSGNPTVLMQFQPSDAIAINDSMPTIHVDIPISLAPGTGDGHYNTNIHIAPDPVNSFSISQTEIHIQITVGGACSGPEVTCFFTDSAFNDLLDCGNPANPIIGNSGGTFQIIANAKKKAVSTKPGQFYYNMLVSNPTDDAKTVDVMLSSSGLLPTNTNTLGQAIAQAAHAAFFDTATGFTDPAYDWNFVNTLGEPCGPYGPCTMTLPAHNTLFVTWHLAWTGIGASVTGISNTCPGSQNITATGAVSGDLTGDCTATATGYLKK